MLNLQKLFETQKVLRDRINYNEPDRFDKLILALLVEIGECANELPEVFKFWSHKKNNYKRALEEYVDVLHFILELGIELGFTDIELRLEKEKNITNQFIELSGQAHDLYFQMRMTGRVTRNVYERLFDYFISLGEMLGFTWEEIEQVYFVKNNINHQRQDTGY